MGPDTSGKFQTILREGVTHISHGDESSLNQPVEKAFDHFPSGDTFRDVLRDQAHFVKCRLDQRTNRLTQVSGPNGPGLRG